MVHHGEALRRLLRDETKTEAILRDPGAAPLSERVRALSDYALELTRRVGEDHRPSLQRLRAAGFDDRGILDLVQIAAYFNFVDRLSEGLGVTLEPDEKD